jgi:polyhydroxyalkanoate synthesis regulator phasin
VWLGSVAPALVALLLFLSAATIPLAARSKEKITYGEGLIINIPMPESEVEQVVEDVAGNGLIRGTREYNKDEFIAGAKPADSSHVFPPWDQGGKVFYKVRMGAIDPRNFKESSDVGTLAVRYVVQPQGEKNTVLRIDALFEEDFRKTVHQSDGSVESAEYKDIREHLDTIEVMKAQNAEAAEERLERLRKKQNMAMQNSQAPPPEITGRSSSQPTPSAVLNEPDPAPAPAPQEPALSSVAPAGQTLEERVRDLRKQVERLVKSPGAPLKSAPFHTASTLQLLSTGTEILIVISTPYWYGVETHEGQHGWMQRDQLEQLP